MIKKCWGHIYDVYINISDDAVCIDANVNNIICQPARWAHDAIITSFWHHNGIILRRVSAGCIHPVWVWLPGDADCFGSWDRLNKDATVSRPSYLYNGNLHNWKGVLYIETGPSVFAVVLGFGMNPENDFPVQLQLYVMTLNYFSLYRPILWAESINVHWILLTKVTSMRSFGDFLLLLRQQWAMAQQYVVPSFDQTRRSLSR